MSDALAVVMCVVALLLVKSQRDKLELVYASAIQASVLTELL